MALMDDPWPDSLQQALHLQHHKNRDYDRRLVVLYDRQDNLGSDGMAATMTRMRLDNLQRILVSRLHPFPTISMSNMCWFRALVFAHVRSCILACPPRRRQLVKQITPAFMDRLKLDQHACGQAAVSLSPAALSDAPWSLLSTLSLWVVAGMTTGNSLTAQS